MVLSLCYSRVATFQVLAVVANVDAIVSSLTILLALCFVAFANRDESNFKREFDSKVKHADGSETRESRRSLVVTANAGATAAAAPRHMPLPSVCFSSKQGWLLKSKSSAGPLQASGRRAHGSTEIAHAPPFSNSIKDKRYFVLMESGQLGWYRSPHDLRTKRPCEVVSLQDVYSVSMTETSTSPPAIALLPSGAAAGTSKSWYLRASTPEETQDWFLALNVKGSLEQDDSSSDEA